MMIKGPSAGGKQRGGEQTQQPVIPNDNYVLILSFIIFCKQTVEDFRETTKLF